MITVLVTEDQKNIILTDGIPQSIKTPARNESKLMEYFISNNNNIDVLLTTESLPLKISITIIRKNYTKEVNARSPISKLDITDTNRLFQSSNNTVGISSVYQRSILSNVVDKVCTTNFDGCILVILIERTSDNSLDSKSDSFEIFITSTIMKINMGKSYPNTIQEGVYQFYMFQYNHPK